jgi:type IV secretory pathway VirD2 relaxase
MDGKGKAPPSAGRKWLVGMDILDIVPPRLLSGPLYSSINSTIRATPIGATRGWLAMTTRVDDIALRPGRIRHGNQRARRPDSFVVEVMRAAKKAGHVGKSFRNRSGAKNRSTFGRGRRAAASLSLQSTARRVVMKARVVRHHGAKFRSAPLRKHIAYLKRDGVSRDGADAQMFDANSDQADEHAFAGRTVDDRHHFRFIISPEDAAELDSLRTFTRELMQDVERDLGTRLDWVAVDHWNTDNPHIHVLIRGRADNGEDLVISRAYISQGFRNRAAERVTLELGPRSEQEIRTSQEREVSAERWTNLDRALRDSADEGGGVIDLRPDGARSDNDLRRLLIGRATKLERLGLVEPLGPAQWAIKPGIEPKLCELGIRGDIIKTMHRAISNANREPDVNRFALHGDAPTDPVLGRLVERGLDDELKGSAYAIIEGIDGRTHHVRFTDLEFTGDAGHGAIVEMRAYEDSNGRHRLSLATRSDLTLEAQISAPGATWIDRQLLAKEPAISGAGFGAEVRDAMHRRVEYLIDNGLAQRQGQRVLFARDLLNTLRQRELDEATRRLSAETGFTHHPSTEGERVVGIYRQRVTLSSGRFAMIDDGIEFQLVPWRPALEQLLGKQVSGVMAPEGGVDWNLGRKRGIGI